MKYGANRLDRWIACIWFVYTYNIQMKFHWIHDKTYRKQCIKFKETLLLSFSSINDYSSYLSPNRLDPPIACIRSVCLVSRWSITEYMTRHIEISVYNCKKLYYSVFEVLTVIHQIWPKSTGPLYCMHRIHISSIQMLFHWIHD